MQRLSWLFFSPLRTHLLFLGVPDQTGMRNASNSDRKFSLVKRIIRNSQTETRTTVKRGVELCRMGCKAIEGIFSLSYSWSAHHLHFLNLGIQSHSQSHFWKYFNYIPNSVDCCVGKFPFHTLSVMSNDGHNRSSSRSEISRCSQRHVLSVFELWKHISVYRNDPSNFRASKINCQRQALTQICETNACVLLKKRHWRRSAGMIASSELERWWTRKLKSVSLCDFCWIVSAFRNSCTQWTQL